jgi:[protein-PII] uridylyltransferase
MVKVQNTRAILSATTLRRRLDDIVHEGTAADLRRQVVAELKRALDEGRAEIRSRADLKVPGDQLAAAQSYLMDRLILVLFDFTIERVYPTANPTTSERMAVTAVGGYGRGELAPFSDIDLLFLLPYKETPLSEQITEYMLYVLWDLGLKVGHSVRSIDESLRQAAKDLTIRTSLLESRHVTGSGRLHAALMRRFKKEIMADNGPDFIEAKLAERDARHARLGDSRYVVEPNLKDGKGGLRDLQTLYWIAKFLYQVEDAAELVEKGVFKRSEYARFEKASRFLWTVRFHLHYLTGRAEERLTFDVQPALARSLGYTDRAGVMMGVERFMKHYFLVAKDVGDLTRIFCAQLEAQHKRKPVLRIPFLPIRSKAVEGFKLDGGRLNVESAEEFRLHPVKMLKLFQVAQEKDLDIHPEALRYITQNLKRIDSLRQDKEANAIFLSILTSRKKPEEALKRMNEAGVFGRFIEDFGRIVAQMQYDMYHHYTVDEHTIHAIGILSRIERGELSGDHPVSAEIIHKLVSRRVLYLALLLHDIAKGRGGDHSELGAEIARRMGPRLGFSGAETEQVAWLVEHHLVMSSTSQKRDIMDPKTVKDFAQVVQSPERLRLLLILTVADIRATGPGIWNAWKGQLLRELYMRTQEVLSGEVTDASLARVKEAQETLRHQLADWPDEKFAAYCEKHYTRYWTGQNADVYEREARLIDRAEAEGEVLAIDSFVDAPNGITEIMVYTQDHPGLFARIAGALSLSGVTVVDARIYTTKDGRALDSFWVQDSEDHEEVSDPHKLERIPGLIRKTLMGEVRPRTLLGRKPSFRHRTDVFTVEPMVLIDNTASDIATVIEVNGRDRVGLLFDLTRALFDLNLSVASAHIATYGERAVDVFYVRDLFGHKVLHRTKLRRIEERLLAAIEGAEKKEAAPLADLPAAQ